MEISVKHFRALPHLTFALALSFSFLAHGFEDNPFTLGRDEFDKGRYVEATKLFKIALSKEPTATAYWYFLGESLSRSGNTNESLCAYAKVLALLQNSGATQGPSESMINRMQQLLANHPSPPEAQCKKLAREISPLSDSEIRSPQDSETRSLKDRLKSCDPKVAIDAAEKIVDDPDTLKEPLELFLPAATLFQHGKKDDAVFWFYAAQLRTRYQLVFEKGDRGQLLAVMMMTIGVPINNYALQNVSNLNLILDHVLEWDKTAPNPFRNKPKTDETTKQIDQIYIGFNGLKTKLLAEKSALESNARATAPMLERTYNQQVSSLCRSGQPDPSYANQIAEKEWEMAMNFVRNNKDVIREVGNIKNVGRESSIKKPGEIVPSRYIVSVGGTRSAYAVLNVSRSSEEVKFTLACLTHLSLGQRDPFKEVCNQ